LGVVSLRVTLQVYCCEHSRQAGGNGSLCTKDCVPKYFGTKFATKTDRLDSNRWTHTHMFDFTLFSSISLDCVPILAGKMMAKCRLCHPYLWRASKNTERLLDPKILRNISRPATWSESCPVVRFLRGPVFFVCVESPVRSSSCGKGGL